MRRRCAPGTTNGDGVLDDDGDGDWVEHELAEHRTKKCY